MMMEEVDLADTPLALQPQLKSQDSVTLSDEDPPDPRIQVELERLNTSTDLINKLEVDLDEARMMFRQTLSESTQQIDLLTKKLGKCIDQARPYYEARFKAKQALSEAQKSAIRYERAVSQHAAAREMVQLAEEGLLTRGCIFDSTWQEMLNHATTKVNDAEKEKIESTVEHKDKSNNYHESETRVKYLQKELKRAITKSSLNARRSLMQLSNLVRMQELQLLPYFELKAAVNQRLEEQKRHVKDLENAVAGAKSNYAQALANLETISDQIHKTRQNRLDLGIRGVGVGAESPGPPLHDINAEIPVFRSNFLSSLSMLDNNKNGYKNDSNSFGETFPEMGCSESLENCQGSDLTGWQFVRLPGTSASYGSNLLSVDDRESIVSDSESLTSMEMLSEEAIANLMLEEEINEATQLICSPMMDEYLSLPRPKRETSSLSPKEVKAIEKDDASSTFLANETIPNKDSELSGNSSSDSVGTWEVVGDTQESVQNIVPPVEVKLLVEDTIGASLDKCNVRVTPTPVEKILVSTLTKDVNCETLSPSGLEKAGTSPTRPKTLPVSPVYCKSIDKPNSKSTRSDSSENSSPDNESTPAYAPLCDTPESLNRSVNI